MKAKKVRECCGDAMTLYASFEDKIVWFQANLRRPINFQKGGGEGG